MIVNVRGTNGSGKSWVARQVMERCGGIVRPLLAPDGALVGHICKDGLVVFGKYTLGDAGGFDNTPKAHRGFDELFERMLEHKRVLVEGLTLSTDYHRSLPLINAGRMKIWYLNLTVGECKQGVNLRREKAGKGPPKSYDNLVSKYRAIELNRKKFELVDYKFPLASPEEAVEQM